MNQLPIQINGIIVLRFLSKLHAVFFIVVLLLLNAPSLNAQRTISYLPPASVYREAVSLFDNENYGAAQEMFSKIIGHPVYQNTTFGTYARFYDAACAFELHSKDCESKLLAFADDYPENSRINLVNYYLAKNAFRNNKFKTAAEYSGKVEKNELTASERTEVTFISGYSHFFLHDNTKAKKEFSEIRDRRNKFYLPALYYSSHIAYAENDYIKAAEGFKELSGSETYKNIAPHYLARIYFAQQKYDEALAVAEQLLEDKENDENNGEINKLVGETYYRQKKYDKALPYLLAFHESKDASITRADYYTLAYCYFKQKNYTDAIVNFQLTSGIEDTLTPYIYYHLGICYLETGQKKFAANSFLAVIKNPTDKAMAEDAMISYAKLSYELSYNPYSEAIKALNDFITQYPKSEKIDEAYNYLVDISIETKNYISALEIIEKIKNRDAGIQMKYQKIAFNRGIELFNAGRYNDAITMFKRSSETGPDQLIIAESQFWTADAFERLENTWGAKKYYENFHSSNASTQSSYFYLAYYNLGYIYFNEKEYNSASEYFNKFLAHKKNEDPELVSDASLRVADCHFIRKDYDKAIEWYDKVINQKMFDVDYALFQKSMGLTATGRYQDAIASFGSLVTLFPKSSYTDDAIYNSGVTYQLLNNNEKALASFNKITSDYPQSSFAPKALQKSGLIYYNSNSNDLALNNLKKVIDLYPNTQEARESFNSIKNIYLDQNNPDGFITYSKDIPFANVSQAEQDSLIYLSAENQYLSGNCDDALKSFNTYLEKFPQGLFYIHANYYKGECHLKKDAFTTALECFNNVISRGKSKFLENSLLKASKIYYNIKEYRSALICFSRLENEAEYNSNITEARYGMMRSANMLNLTDTTVIYSDRYLTSEKLTDQQLVEAMMIKGRALYNAGRQDETKPVFEKVLLIADGLNAAEAKYYLCLIEFNLGNYKLCEAMIFELTNKYSAYDYWVAKSFILLADSYLKTGNNFQAKETLKSVMDNYEGDDLRKIAAEKLEAIIEQENLGKKDIENPGNELEDVDLEDEGL